MDAELCALLETTGLVARRQLPHLQSSIDWALRCGRMTRLLPGVFAAADRADDVDVRTRAVNLWDPDAVVCGAAAARLLFWPKLLVDAVVIATKRQPRADFAGYTITRRSIDVDLIVETGGLRLTNPALTVLDLIGDGRGSAIDEALRMGACTLGELHRTLERLPDRIGNRMRRELLDDSRDEPWSELERTAHRVLRAAGLTGWSTNFPVWIGPQKFMLDIPFRELKVLIEVDGWEYHGSRTAFENDRARNNALVADGWRVLHLTWRMLSDNPQEFIEQVRRVLALQTSHQCLQRCRRHA